MRRSEGLQRVLVDGELVHQAAFGVRSLKVVRMTASTGELVAEW